MNTQQKAQIESRQAFARTLAEAHPLQLARGSHELAGLLWPGVEPALLLVHASGFHKEIWIPTVTALRAERAMAILSVDLTGHGDSEEVEDGPDVWSYASDVVSAVRSAWRTSQSGPLIGVGHSLGGMAVAGAQIVASCFDAIVLFDPALIEGQDGRRTGETMSWATVARRRRAAFDSRDAALEAYKTKPVFRSWPRPVLELYVDHGFREVDGRWTLKCRPEWEASTFSQPSFPEVWEQLDAIDVPVLLVTGEDSVTHDEIRSHRTAERLGAAHRRVDGVGHFLPVEKPVIAAAEIVRFIDTVSKAR